MKIIAYKNQATRLHILVTNKKLKHSEITKKKEISSIITTRKRIKLLHHQRKLKSWNEKLTTNFRKLLLCLIVHELFDFVSKLVSCVRTRFSFRRSKSARFDFVAKKNISNLFRNASIWKEKKRYTDWVS